MEWPLWSQFIQLLNRHSAVELLCIDFCKIYWLFDTDMFLKFVPLWAVDLKDNIAEDLSRLGRPKTFRAFV